MSIAALLLALVSPSFAGEPALAPPALEDACSSEIGILCRARSGARLLACLEEHESDLLRSCRAALDAEHDRIARDRSEREAAAQEAKLKAEQGDEQEARLVRVAGSVYLRTDAMAEGRFIAAEEGMPLSAGDHVRTGADGTAVIALEGQSLVLLSPDSDFVIVSLHPDETELFLGLGRLVAKVGKLLPGKLLRFATPSASAMVRGTELAVEHPLTDAGSRVAVFDEGKVSVQSLAGGPEVAVGPNQETEVGKKGPPQPVKPLNALQAAKPALVQTRQHLGTVQKDWKPLSARPRAVKRLDLARKPSLGPGAPTGVSAAHHPRSYPVARQRQRELRARLSRNPAPKP